MRTRLAVLWRLCWISAMMLSVAGCVGNPVKEMPNLEVASIGAITSKLAEDIKPGASQADESANFRHWHHYFQYCRSCYERRLLDQQFFGAYRPACDARQGRFIYQPSMQSPRRIECLSSSGALLFAVFAKTESKTVPGVGTATLWFIAADSFETKEGSAKANLYDEYMETQDGFRKRDKEQERLEVQMRRDQAKKDAELQKLTEEQRRRRQEEQTAHELPLVKTVGQKVCQTATGNERRLVAYAMGEPVFADPVGRQFLVTGFTEQVSGNRIRVLIGGISVLNSRGVSQHIDRLSGDVILEIGKPTWDDARNWRACE